MTIVEVYNVLEAAFWFGLALLAAWVGGRTRGFTRRTQVAMVALLAAFGVSDLIELYTGAWWRPPALLVFKGICLTGLVTCAFLIYRRRWLAGGSAAN